MEFCIELNAISLYLFVCLSAFLTFNYIQFTWNSLDLSKALSIKKNKEVSLIHTINILKVNCTHSRLF